MDMNIFYFIFTFDNNGCKTLVIFHSTFSQNPSLSRHTRSKQGLYPPREVLSCKGSQPVQPQNQQGSLVLNSQPDI